MSKSYLYRKVPGERRILNKAIDVNKYMRDKTKDYVNGVNIEPIDTRTTSEKLDDNIALSKNFEAEIYNLFNNDPEFSNDFINKFNNSNYHYAEFDLVYNELLKRFKGKLMPSNGVYTTMEHLLNNLKETGTTTTALNKNNLTESELKDAFQELIIYLDQQYEQKNIKKQKGDDMMNKIHALNHLLYENDDHITSVDGKPAASKIKQKISINYTNQLVDLLMLAQKDEFDTNKLQDLITVLGQIKKIAFLEMQKTGSLYST